MYIANVAEKAAITPQTAPKTAQEETIKKTTTLASDNSDKYVKSEQTFTPAYTKKTAAKDNAIDVNKNYKGSVMQSRADHLAEVVQTLISKQCSKADKNQFIDSINEKIKETTGDAANIDQIESAEPMDNIEDYWGAENTSQRIFDFAKNLAGNNDELFDDLKESFIRGFGLAEGDHSGKGSLPSVCYDTYDKVMEKFDEWEKEIQEKNIAENSEPEEVKTEEPKTE